MNNDEEKKMYLQWSDKRCEQLLMIVKKNKYYATEKKGEKSKTLSKVVQDLKRNEFFSDCSEMLNGIVVREKFNNIIKKVKQKKSVGGTRVNQSALKEMTVFEEMALEVAKEMEILDVERKAKKQKVQNVMGSFEASVSGIMYAPSSVVPPQGDTASSAPETAPETLVTSLAESGGEGLVSETLAPHLTDSYTVNDSPMTDMVSSVTTTSVVQKGNQKNKNKYQPVPIGKLFETLFDPENPLMLMERERQEIARKEQEALIQSLHSLTALVQTFIKKE
jgi:hypothetical protein